MVAESYCMEVPEGMKNRILSGHVLAVLKNDRNV